MVHAIRSTFALIRTVLSNFQRFFARHNPFCRTKKDVSTKDDRVQIRDEQEYEEPGQFDLTSEGRRLALESLGNFVKGGKYQFLSELAQISTDDYVKVGSRLYAIPYKYEKRLRFRERWEGLTILDAFMNDEDKLAQGDADYWKEEIESGRLVTRDGPVTDDFRWRVGESVWHTRHGHEPPIGSEDIEIVHLCSRFVALSKPPSMPVHPSGKFRRCSLIYLVAARFALRRLFVVHRIDAVTGGLVIFGRTREAAAELHKKNKAHEIQKTYLAEVEGHFPHAKFTCNEPLGFSTKARVDKEKGKEATTNFRRLVYKPSIDTTVLEVKPRSGRQHQIRVHLKYLGHPIIGDPIYGSGPAASLSDENHDLHHVHVSNAQEVLEEGTQLKCKNCPKLFIKELRTNAGSIHLHALRYQTDDFCFTTQPPHWAREAVGMF